jgi:hypothetical protein
MGVQTTVPMYKTSDGTEFASRVEAERYDKMLVAQRAFEQARKDFGQALAETQRTADGELFRLGVPNTYWLIVHSFGMPHAEPVSFGRWEDSFSVHEDRGVSIRKDGKNYRISSLYARRRAADEALLAVQDQWVSGMRDEVEKLRARLAARGA